MTPEVQAIAEAQAVKDRALLEALRARDRQPFAIVHPKDAPEMRAILGLRPRPKVNLAIRPKKRKRNR